MLKCRDIATLLHDYVEGALEPPLQEQLDQHLSDCPGCVAFVNTYKHTITLAKDLRCEDIPPELRRKLRSFLKQKVNRPTSLWTRLLFRLTGRE
jgi:anti-sigma factor RsiW